MSRPIKYYTEDGEPAVDVARANGIRPQTFRKRVLAGWDIDEACVVPAGAGPMGHNAHQARKGDDG